MRLWAHRGSHRAAIENTLDAFRLAIDEGADGVELDVRATLDGQVVCFHDADLVRLAGDRRAVAETPRADLPEVGGAPIPTLDEALDLLLEAGLEVNVELKAGGAALARVLAARPERQRAALVLSCFEADALARVAEAVGSIRTALLFDEYGPQVEARARGFDGLHPHHRACSRARVAAWRAAGRFVNVWTVNEPSLARRLAAMGIDGLVTDDVPRVREACRSQA